MKEKLIRKISKALRREQSSKETKVRRIGTANIMSTLGSYHGIITVFLLSAVCWFIVIMLVSCGSSKSLINEKVNEKVVSATQTDSVGENTQQKTSYAIIESSDSSQKIREEEKTDSEYREIVTITETTIYDSDTMADGKQKVKQTIKQTKLERHGSSSNAKLKASSTERANEKTITKDDEKNTDRSSRQYANAENREHETRTDKKQSVSESKQIYYIALTFFGIVLIIIVGILAYWVFSKYRQRS